MQKGQTADVAWHLFQMPHQGRAYQQKTEVRKVEDMKYVDKIEIYKDEAGEWRWRLVAPNGQLIASSGEGFRRKWSAKRSAKRVLRSS